MKYFARLALAVGIASVTLIALAAFVAATGTAVPQVAHAQASQTPTPSAGATTRTDIGVTGSGHVSADPDVAIASVGVDITATTLADATKQASDKMTAVLAAIKAQGVDAKDIQTSSYNVYPITNQPKEGETPAITGYHVSNVVTVKVRTIANVGKVLDSALTAGANSINSVSFTVDDPSKFQDQARTLAVQQAMATAKTLADAAGVKVGRIISITDVQQGVVPVFRGAFESAPAASSAGPVETGQTDITANVEMHFEIEQ